MRLRAGQLVEVRSREEILATLDAEGCLEGMPFMPEMLEFCGRRLRVYKRAHKSCDTVNGTGGVRIGRTVHLEEARCDGEGHGGCQASCLLFWREEWLKPVAKEPADSPDRGSAGAEHGGLPARWSYRTGPDVPEHELRYRCQATDLPRFSRHLPWWDIRQYLEDVTSGNVGLRLLFRGLAFSAFRAYVRHGPGFRAIKAAYNWIQDKRRGTPFPFVDGSLTRTPNLELDLVPGERVRVRAFEDIVATLDTRSRNRGLLFDTQEMRLACRRTFRVRSRIERIIDERTGEMMRFSNRCVTLEGLYCTGETTQNRLFCPRAIVPYWREIWLERVSRPGEADPQAPPPRAAQR
jgi:hypothetical protein